MRPRWQVVLLMLSLPIWFLPVMIWVGWKEAGHDVIFRQTPSAMRWLFKGQES